MQNVDKRKRTYYYVRVINKATEQRSNMNTETLINELEAIYSEYYGEIKDRFQETLQQYNTHSVEELVDYFLGDLNSVDLLSSVDLSNVDLEAILFYTVDFLRLYVPTDVVLWEYSHDD